ncbi:uncharacterized protein LOC120612737 isoform X2 [Pteropus medius]|uniref:uncharacterized protein LOC120612737 isoform X2 n=1 Tax=Pteropus vampyrus TaxID=132908 RepID=UPI00196A7085|nr:uncharacterized protein LOC120612737 isoform X2 [Pteropus giganteus]
MRGPHRLSPARGGCERRGCRTRRGGGECAILGLEPVAPAPAPMPPRPVSQGYNSGPRAEETERFSSGGRKASVPAPFRTWALRMRRAPATPMNFLNAFPHFSSSGSAGPERSGGARPRVQREGGRGEGWPVRDLLERHLRGADAGPIQHEDGSAWCEQLEHTLGAGGPASTGELGKGLRVAGRGQRDSQRLIGRRFCSLSFYNFNRLESGCPMRCAPDERIIEERN